MAGEAEVLLPCLLTLVTVHVLWALHLLWRQQSNQRTDTSHVLKYDRVGGTLSLTASFDSRLADVGNPLVRQLGRYLLWPRVGLVPRSVNRERRVPADQSRLPLAGGQVDQTNRARQWFAKHFSAALTEVLPWFSSVVRWIPGHNLMQRRGSARTPTPRRGGFT